MSRVGKMPVLIPDTVNVEFNKLNIVVTGPKGVLSREIVDGIELLREGSVLNVTPSNESRESRAKHGMMRSMIYNMVKGVSDGFSNELEITGVGYKASLVNNYLNLNLGYSHAIKVMIPKEISVACPKPTTLILSSFDKEKLGQFTDIVKRQRSTEPYKGKGIKIKGQFVRRKEGKKK